MTAKIFDIKHFAVHDGPGIRTTLFFKGCPLRCLWCHNPESISPKPQLSYLAHKCTACGKCAEACKNGAHSVTDGVHLLLREHCTLSGQCASVCPSEALTVYGKEVEIGEMLSELLEDRDFYGDDGGVTLSGGECLLQADFCRELLIKLKESGIHTAVDTCGFVSRAELDKVIPYTDLFLYDLKAFDPAVHKACTGVSNELILENLRYLDLLGKEIEIRIPLIPEHNASEIDGIAKFISSLKSVSLVKLLPYHSYGKSKYQALGMRDTSPKRIPDALDLEKATKILLGYGLKTAK